jgi:chromosome segregation ATPase
MLDPDDGLYTGRDPMAHRNTRLSPNPVGVRDSYMASHGLQELQSTNSDLQRDLANLKKELELTNQKLGSSMHSIKTFWSPELKKERALRKEESAKYALMNDQLKLLNSENQKQAMLVRQLEDEVVKAKTHASQTNPEVKAHLEALQVENDHLSREIAILRETVKELEMRIDTQKQTLTARDESIKKLLEMLQNKGEGKEEEARVHQHMQMVAQKQLDDMRVEVSRREQEIMQMATKMKTLEEQHQDYQKHIAVLKESLCAKEEHYTMLQTDVSSAHHMANRKVKEGGLKAPESAAAPHRKQRC